MCFSSFAKVSIEVGWRGEKCGKNSPGEVQLHAIDGLADSRLPDGTPLVVAARGDEAVLEALLEAGADPNAADPRGLRLALALLRNTPAKMMN